MKDNITEVLPVKDMDIENLEMSEELISFDEYVKGLPEAEQGQVNSLAKAIAKRFGITFMDVRRLPFQKALKLLDKYTKAKQLREEMSFLAKKSESS